jgi:uncharacterized protein (TIGR02757 family)
MTEQRSDEIKLLLDVLAEKYNRQEFIADDPIRIPHQYRVKEDIEISAFLSAILAWGGRLAILKAATLLMELMDHAPAQFILEHEPSDLKRFSTFVYRTMQPADIQFLVTALADVYRNHGGLQQLFTTALHIDAEHVYEAITQVRSVLLRTPHLQRSEKHLADPESGSAAKRINLFLRWMVRKDQHGVDFGLWPGIRPNQLICPLDIHTGNAARELGLITRKANDRKAATTLTQILKTFDPIDPVKYDFALFGYSLFSGNRERIKNEK